MIGHCSVDRELGTFHCKREHSFCRLLGQGHCHSTHSANWGLLRYYNLGQALCSQLSCKSKSCEIIPGCLRRKQIFTIGQNPRSWPHDYCSLWRWIAIVFWSMLNEHHTSHCGFNHNKMHYAFLATHRDYQIIWHYLFSYSPSWF